jgi:two-component system nitrate/nitrite sensor histidine kinase NarX
VTHVFSPELSRTADSAILARIAADLASGDDLRGLLHRFLDPIVRLAHAQAGAVRVLSPHGDRLELVSAIGLPPAIHEAERLVDSHCGFCGEASDERRIVWATDLESCSKRCGEYFGSTCRRVLAVPLVHKGRVLGIYNLFFTAEDELSPDIAALLRSIGELLGLALDNLRLEAENMRATVMHERQAMAAEVHDSVAQNLTFIKMRLPLLRDAILAHDQERALKFLDDVRETAGEAHGSLREIVTQFRTRIDPRGLGRAFDALAKRFCMRTGIELQLANRMPALRLGENEELDVFHIVQEALVNIERHSGARHAWLSIEPTLAGVVLKVEDDGVGPRPRGEGEAAGAHYGIDIMSERARRLHGELRVTPRAAGGTQVRLAVPIPKAGEVAT